MHMFTERTQVLLTRDQRLRLEHRAAEERRSIGALIREAVDAYVGSPTRSRAEAASRLMGLDAPVGDWEAMKAEILRGATGAMGATGAAGAIDTTPKPAVTRPRRSRGSR
jgi:hypothetical protein